VCHQRCAEALSAADAVLSYRHEYRSARIFNRLKSRVQIAPLFVTRDDHIEGRTYLLTWGVRVLAGLECVLRQSLQNAHTHLAGLHPENGKKLTDTPTAERVLKAFPDVSLTIRKTVAGEEILRWLGLATSLYRQLEIQNGGY